MDRKKIHNSGPYFSQANILEILNRIESTLKSGILTHGSCVKEFERKFADYMQANYAVAVNSGTSNLELVMRYFGVRDKEVIVPTNTFVASPNSVIFAGGRPVFTDILEDSLCLDPVDVEKKISPKTAGVMVVHVAGLVCPQIEEVKKLCLDHDLFLIEDCSHAHGAMLKNKKAGTFGQAGCFSFYPTKVITAGEGGMIITEDSCLVDEAYKMRNHGLNSDGLMVTFGHNWCMSEVNAIIGENQLRNLDYFIDERNVIARNYDKLLGQIEEISLLNKPPEMRHAYYKYLTRFADNIDTHRLAHKLLEEYGIQTGYLYYPPCHLHPFYQKYFKGNNQYFPVATKVLKKILCLPMHLGISKEDVEYIANAIACSVSSSKVN